MSDSETRRPRHALVDDEVVVPETAEGVDVAEPGAATSAPDTAPGTDPDPVDEPEPAREPAGTAADVPEAVDPPTTALPVQRTGWPEQRVPGEFTDDATMVLPVIPSQRTASPIGSVPPRVNGRPGPAVAAPAEYSRPAPPAERRRRVLPAVLAAVTAALLVAGVAVGIGGAPADLATPPAPTATP